MKNPRYGMMRALGLGLLVTLGLTLVSCARSIVPRDSVRLIIPFSDNNSSFAAGDVLEFAIVNVQAVGKPPLVRKYEFGKDGSGGLAWGQPIDLVVENVPNGPGMIVQFLGGFKTAGGAMLLTYGDATVDVGIGNNTVNIAATPVATAVKQGRVAGRYFTTSTPTPNGPTGPMIVYFTPPNGKPKMAVDRTSIVAGWFNIFVLDFTPLTYEILDPSAGTSELLFEGAITMGSAALVSAGANVIKYTAPTYYSKRYNGSTSTIEASAGGELTLGFFKKSSVSMSMTPYAACGVSGSLEVIPNWYTASDLSTAVQYTGISGTTLSVHRLTGGYMDSFSNVFTDSYCNPASGDDVLRFYHTRLSDNDNEFAGIAPPFKVIDPFVQHGGYLRAEFDDSSAPSKIKLEWAYLAGASPTISSGAISGIEILSKYSANGGGSGGDHDKSCEDYKASGYAVIANLTTSATKYDFSPAGLHSGNYYGHMFAVCPYMMAGTQKIYTGSIITGSAGNSDNELGNTGWGTTSYTYTSPASNFNSPVLAHYDRVSGVDDSDAAFTVVSLAGGGYTFAAGDEGGEVLLTVAAQGASGACGSFKGQPIGVGTRIFTRILFANGSFLRIPKGTFVTQLIAANLSPIVSQGSTQCLVQAIRVPHFINLTINPNIDVNLGKFTIDGGVGPGILAFRVSGALSFGNANSMISVSGGGYHGGDASNPMGAGVLGARSNAVVGNNSGGYGNISVGGGGAGPWANGGAGKDDTGAMTGLLGGTYSMGGGNGEVPLLLGGGGGGIGGDGGGAIFIVAKKVIAPSGGKLLAGGDSFAGTGGGGGGGGSIALVAHSAAGSLTLDVSGGNGQNNGAITSAGGGGGGGVVSHLICSGTLAKTEVLSAGLGPAGASASAGASYDLATSGWGNYICQ